MTEPTLEDQQKAQREEYGTYVAAQDITYNGVLAYRAGHPVPVSNVKLHGYDKNDLVVKAGTKAAEKAVPSETPKG